MYLSYFHFSPIPQPRGRISFSEAELNTLTGGFTPTDFSPFKKNPGSFSCTPPGVVRFNQREHIHHTWVHTKTLRPRPPEIVGQKHLVQSSPSENIKKHQKPRNARFYRLKFKYKQTGSTKKRGGGYWSDLFTYIQDLNT